ncbi:hypothetical protein ABPG74_022411 [Tetrahymena malaccensis]
MKSRQKLMYVMFYLIIVHKSILKIKQTFFIKPQMELKKYISQTCKIEEQFENKTCLYRMTTFQGASKNFPNTHLSEYIKNYPFQNYRQYLKLTAIIKKISPTDQATSKNNAICIVSSTLNEGNNNQDIKLKSIFNFLDQNKQNQYKNILNAFKRHIDSCSDERLSKLYQNLSQENWPIEHIKKRVNINLKNCCRLNLKIKNLITNNNLKNIFIHFLKNCQQFWLNDSKIVNKEQYIEIINIMIEAYDKNILQQFTKYYKKKK